MTELDVQPAPRDVPDDTGLTLPAPNVPKVEAPMAPTTAPNVPRRLPTTWLLAATVSSATGAGAIAALQMGRAMGGRERIEALTPPQLVMAVLAAVGVVAWTWMVVENARRLLAAGRTAEAPVPRAVAAAWAMPLLVAVAAAGSTAFLERRLNTAESDTTSAVPLAIALSFIVIVMLVSYRPLFMLSSIMRRLGSASGALARWIWVPISLVVAGAATLVSLRAGGAYGDGYEGVAPAWALGIVALPPLVILLALSWRGGRAVEASIGFAFDRRTGRNASGVGRRWKTLAKRGFRLDASSSFELDTRRHVRVVPGADILRLALMTAVAALTLVSIVGALVMFLFWREAGDGTLLPSQRDRAWSALGGLQTIERMLAAGLVAIASIWSLISVLNARIASGRRRNPLLAAAAWPAAAYAIWRLAIRLDDAETVVDALVIYGLQVVALYVPFFLLERSATAVGARGGPLRLSFAITALLLIHIQGLGGLATLVEVNEIDRFGRLAGYLALAALLELIATIAITEASHLIADSAASVAEKHNFLADQRSRDVEPPKQTTPMQRPPAGPPASAVPPVAIAASSMPAPSGPPR